MRTEIVCLCLKILQNLSAGGRWGRNTNKRTLKWFILSELLCMPDSNFINRTARLWVTTLPWLLHPSTQLAGGRGSETGSKLETIYYCWSRKLIALLLLLPPFWNTPPRETCAEKSLWTNTWRVTEHGPYVVATKNKPKSEMRTVKWIHNVSLYATVTDGQWTVTRQTKTS